MSAKRLVSSRLAASCGLMAALLTCGCNCRSGGGSGAESQDAGETVVPPVIPSTGDETAGGESTPTCLNEPVEGQFRTRRQCSGSVQATLTLDVTIAGIEIAQDPVPIEKEFGDGQTGDDYADPLVMACCADEDRSFCILDASQSCYLDLIQTSCQSLPARIAEKAAEQSLLGPKEALKSLSTWMRDHQDTCRIAFGYSEIESASPACGAGDASGYESVLAGKQWDIPGTFSGGTTVISNVLITVNQASVTGSHTGEPPESCLSLEDNDDAPHFIEIFPSGLTIKTK